MDGWTRPQCQQHRGAQASQCSIDQVLLQVPWSSCCDPCASLVGRQVFAAPSKCVTVAMVCTCAVGADNPRSAPSLVIHSVPPYSGCALHHSKHQSTHWSSSGLRSAQTAHAQRRREPSRTDTDDRDCQTHPVIGVASRQSVHTRLSPERPDPRP